MRRFGGAAPLLLAFFLLASCRTMQSAEAPVQAQAEVSARRDGHAKTWNDGDHVGWSNHFAPDGLGVHVARARVAGEWKRPLPQMSEEIATSAKLLSEGSDTRTACASGVFYQVTAPVSGETTFELAAPETLVQFSIAPCPDLPTDLGVLIPIDTLAPDSADVPEGETPISEVRGTRDENPNNPLPPRVGNSAPVATNQSNFFALVLLTGALAMLVPAAGSTALAVRSRVKR